VLIVSFGLFFIEGPSTRRLGIAPPKSDIDGVIVGRIAPIGLMTTQPNQEPLGLRP